MNERTGKGWINTRLHWNDFNIQSWHCSDPSLETFYSPPLLIICSNTATQQWRCRIISSQCFTHRNFTSSPPHRLNRVRLISDRGKRGAFSELTGSMSRAAGKKINRIITFSKRKPPLPGEPASSSGHHDNPRSGEDTDWSRSCLTDFLAGWLVSGVLNECSKVREKFGLKTYDHDYHVLWFRLVLCWKKVRMHILEMWMWRYIPPHSEYQVSPVEEWTYYCANSYHDRPQTEADWLKNNTIRSEHAKLISYKQNKLLKPHKSNNKQVFLLFQLNFEFPNVLICIVLMEWWCVLFRILIHHLIWQ